MLQNILPEFLIPCKTTLEMEKSDWIEAWQVHYIEPRVARKETTLKMNTCENSYASYLNVDQETSWEISRLLTEKDAASHNQWVKSLLFASSIPPNDT